jgi:hypothetical protein
MDVGSVLASVHRERLLLGTATCEHAMPAWANWLVWLGQWMRSQTPLPGRRIAVVRLPTRRLSAAFVSLGALLMASRLHDGSLDWEALQALPKGTTVHWRENKQSTSISYTGVVGSVRDCSGSPCLALEVQIPKRAKGTTFLLPKATALFYGVTLGKVTAHADERLSAAADLVRSIVEGGSAAWIRSPAADSTLVTERASFRNEVLGLSIAVPQTRQIPLLDALTISDNPSAQHGKLQLVSPRAEPFADLEKGITILDGAAAAPRIGNSRARSLVLLLDHAEYDEDIVHTLNPFMAHSIDEGIHVPAEGVLAVPDGIEAFVLGLPRMAGQQT